MSKIRKIKSKINHKNKQVKKRERHQLGRSILGPRHKRSIGFIYEVPTGIENPYQIGQIDSESAPIVEGQMSYRNGNRLGGSLELKKLILNSRSCPVSLAKRWK